MLQPTYKLYFLASCQKLILPTKTTIVVPSDLKAIDSVLLQFNKIYQTRIVQQDWLKCQLALVEGFTNVVRHAHRDLPPDTSIQIAIAIVQTKITIQIWDYGKPFDLAKFITSMKQKDRNWQGSGRGIAIMYKIADEISYTRVPHERNCLKIVKYLSN